MKDDIDNGGSILPIFLIVAVVMAIIFGLVFFFIEDGDERAQSISDAITKSTANNMTHEQRAGNVALWTQDVAATVKPSHDRDKFTNVVEGFTEDKKITAEEYIMISNGYDQLKSYAYFDDINNSIKSLQESSCEADANNC